MSNKHYRTLAIFLVLTLFLGIKVAWAESPVVLQTLLLEARGEGLLGMQAVGEVIRTRAKERGMSFDDVCLQRKQFSCWNNRLDAYAKIMKFGKSDYSMASQAWRFSKRSNITKGANLYANLALCSPSWVGSNKVKKTVKVLSHTFFKE